MNRFARRARAAVILAALALGGLSATAPLAAASPTGGSFKVPFKDPYIHGWLTFCNRSNQRITSGSITTWPFVWKAISSEPPPPGYGSPGGRAALYGFQPIQYVNPGDWVGYALTSASSFSNTKHPVAQATNIDQPLVSFTSGFPLHWDGLAVIGMTWTALAKGSITTPYAGAIVRVTGSTWTLVKGGITSCSAGTGVSDEVQDLPKKDLAKRMSSSPAPTSSQQAGGSGAASAGGQSSGGSQSGASQAGADGQLVSSDSSAGLSGVALAGIAVGAVAVIWAAIGAFAFWRRRRAVS
jgi:hypothetical protein